MADETCAVFGRHGGGLDPERIHRFLVGEDAEPGPMTTEEVAALGDAFATLLLRNGRLPRTAQECLTAFDDVVGDGDALREQMTFLVGEATQIPFETAPSLERSVRFVITRGANADGPPEGPDVLLSASDPAQSEIELMAWDREAGGFNYYRAVGPGPTWVFAGNARHALAGSTEGKGPFESHVSGALLMRELKRPWVHWHSPDAPVFGTAFRPDDPLRAHEWFTHANPGGAYAIEFEVARPAMARWAKARFDAFVAAGGNVEDPRRIMAQLLGTATVNLVSSFRESEQARSSSAPLDLPPTFFVDADGLDRVGLRGPPAFEVAGNVYDSALRKFEVKLVDERSGFEQEGDTHFAFVVPERAFEDEVVVTEALRTGLVSRRLVACLLMTDFPNPIFSARRAALLAHVPERATLSEGGGSFAQEMASAILAAADTSPDGSPEREFAERWSVGEDFEAEFDRVLGDYFAAVTRRLATQEGFDDYFELAEARRGSARENPVFKEFPLLFARSDVSRGNRVMRADGTVA